MKKLCVKQNRRAKQWGLAKFANTSQSVRKHSEFGNAIANLAMVLRSWQWCCEVGNVLRSWQCGCEVGKAVCEVGNAKFR